MTAAEYEAEIARLRDERNEFAAQLGEMEALRDRLRELTGAATRHCEVIGGTMAAQGPSGLRLRSALAK